MTLISCSSSVGLKESEDPLDFDEDDIVIEEAWRVRIIGLVFSDSSFDILTARGEGMYEGRKM